MRRRQAQSGQAGGLSYPSGFTLLEMIVVIAVIGLALGIVLPTMVGLFTAGSDKKARNMLASLLSAARTLAIENQAPSLMHTEVVGARDSNGKIINGKAWLVTMKLDTDPKALSYGSFVPVMGIEPRELPGSVALGPVESPAFVSGQFQRIWEPGNAGVTVVNYPWLQFIFNADGTLTTNPMSVRMGNRVYCNPNGTNLVIDFDKSVFLWQYDINASIPNYLPAARAGDQQRINDMLGIDNTGKYNPRNGLCLSPQPPLPPPAQQPVSIKGVRAVVIYDYKTFNALSDKDDTFNGTTNPPQSRANYLKGCADPNIGGGLICVNPYTGQIIPNEP